MNHDHFVKLLLCSGVAGVIQGLLYRNTPIVADNGKADMAELLLESFYDLISDKGGRSLLLLSCIWKVEACA